MLWEGNSLKNWVTYTANKMLYLLSLAAKTPHLQLESGSKKRKTTLWRTSRILLQKSKRFRTKISTIPSMTSYWKERKMLQFFSKMRNAWHSKRLTSQLLKFTSLLFPKTRPSSLFQRLQRPTKKFLATWWLLLIKLPRLYLSSKDTE